MSDVFVTVTVPGKPTPKERPRHGANGNTYTPRGTEEYEQAIGWAGRQAMRGRRPTWERLAVTVDLYGDCKAGDVDNYAKVILDGCNGIVWVDDKQIDDLHVRRHQDPTAGHAVMVVVELTQGSPEPRRRGVVRARKSLDLTGRRP